MKILLASGSGINDDAYPETLKNNSGFGHMMRAIAVMLSTEQNEVDILTQSVLTPGRDIEKARLLKRKTADLLLHFKPFYFFRAFRMMLRRDYSFGTKARTMLYYMTGSYCEYLIRKNKYDVVHINGIENSSMPYLYACARTNTPFVLTLHGLISFDPSVRTDRFSKNLERVFTFAMKENPDILCTVISSGIKKRLVGCCGAEDLPGMSVVCNPIIETSEKAEPIAKKAKYVIVVIGNVSERKNQRLVVDAFRLLPEEIRGQSLLYIIGGNEAGLKEYVERENMENIVFTGTVSRGEVNAYLDIADFCAVASVDEGFGLSIIEAYGRGTPVVMPRSVDAFEDVYNDNATVAVDDYLPGSFRDAFVAALSRKWDKEYIRSLAGRFGMDKCSEEYLSVLSAAAKKNKCSMSVKDVEGLQKKASCFRY